MNEKNYLTLGNLGEIQLHGFNKLIKSVYAVITAGNSIVFEVQSLPMQKSGRELEINSNTRIIHDEQLYNFLYQNPKLIEKRFIFNEVSSGYYPTDIDV